MEDLWWLLTPEQRGIVKLLMGQEQIMAKQADADRAIAGVRQAVETERGEIKDALDRLTEEVRVLREEGSISDASIAALDQIAADISGIISAPLPGEPTEPEPEPTEPV